MTAHKHRNERSDRIKAVSKSQEAKRKIRQLTNRELTQACGGDGDLPCESWGSNHNEHQLKWKQAKGIKRSSKDHGAKRNGSELSNGQLSRVRGGDGDSPAEDGDLESLRYGNHNEHQLKWKRKRVSK